MIHLAATISMLLLLAGEGRPMAALDVSAHEAGTTEPQGPKRGAGMYSGPNGSPPRGGTPEPSLLLLMSGGALAYGALRRKNQRQAKTPEA